jgi:hypothetical protein
MIMLFQTECVFTIPPSINAWRTEIFQSLDIKLDQIIRCNEGFYPLDQALGVTPAMKQHDIQDLEA